MVYCVFGLPLTLMCMANLGKFFARIFRILYHACCCGICCICCLAYRRKKVAERLANSSETQATAGSLDVLGNGKPLSISNDPKSKEVSLQKTISKAQVWLLNVKKKFSHSMRDDVTVPVYLCLVVITLYIMGGGLLFSIYDKWDYMASTYFCFVTLTTIGFGDYVPGIVSGGSTSDRSSTERLVVCTMYLFVGLALVGMCIDLMQADVIKKLTWLAKKIGIIGRGEDQSLSQQKMEPLPEYKQDYDDSDDEHILMVDVEKNDSPAKKPLLSRHSEPVLYEQKVDPPPSNIKKKNRVTTTRDDKGVTFVDEVKTEPTKPLYGSVTPAGALSRSVSAPSPDIDDEAVQARPLKPTSSDGTDWNGNEKDKKLSKHKNSKLNGQSSEKGQGAKKNGGKGKGQADQGKTLDSSVSPPAYDQACSTATAAAASPPVSYYDDLPSHITTTPLHVRLQDLVSINEPASSEPGYIRERTTPAVAEPDSFSRDEVLDRILNEPVFCDTSQPKAGKRLHMYFDDDNEETLLAASRTSNV